LIITDQGVTAAGLITLVTEALAGAEIPGDVLFDRVPPDSSPKIVDQAAGVYRKHDCDCIVSVGGGSVIDTGKAVNIVVTEDADSLAELKGTKLPRTLAEAGVEKEAFGEIAQKAVIDPALSLNPRSVSYEDALEILNFANFRKYHRSIGNADYDPQVSSKNTDIFCG
jgi:alcohol dehydrogenase class IV